MNFKKAIKLVNRYASKIKEGKKISSGIIKDILDLIAPFAWMFGVSPKLKEAYKLICDLAKKSSLEIKASINDYYDSDRVTFLKMYKGLGNSLHRIDKKLANKLYNMDENLLTKRGAEQDISLPIFEELLDEGYDKVKFKALPTSERICQSLNNKTWDLEQFINETTHEAPIFSHTHVNARSPMVVYDSIGELEPVEVYYYGRD